MNINIERLSLKSLSFLVILILIQIFTVSALHVDTNSSLFIDQYNRTLIFHGVNVVFKTFPFHPDT